MKNGELDFGKPRSTNGDHAALREGFIVKTTESTQSAKWLREYLGFRPVEVVRRTLECTTQLARLQTSGNL
jgi:hypothetical protein